MAFSSKVLYTGDGVTTDYTVTFPYLSTSHVQVFVNDTLQLATMHYVWTNSSTIQFVTAPAVSAAIEIKRNTSPTNTLVDFEDGSTLRAGDLDTAYLHNYYLGQEYADGFNALINEALLAVATDVGIVETETDEVITALVTEMLADANAANLQQRIEDIDANAEAIITLGDSLQVQVNSIAQGVAATVYIQDAEPVPGVGGVPDPIPEGARWYDSDDNNAPYIYASSAWVSIEDPRIGNAVADISVLQTETSDNAAAIVTESLARTTGDSALASTLALLGAENGAGTAFILDLATTEVSDGESLATRFSTIEADATSAANTYTDAEITTEATARADADTAIATTISLIGAENGGATAFILDTSTVKIDSDVGDTFATRLSDLAAADSANSASISTIQSVTIPGVESDVATLEAKYGVTLNVNGYITGFAQNNDGESGTFVILADKFAVVDPSGDPGETEYVPFEISGGKINMRSDVQIDGNLMVAGTINGSALINGTIGSTQIGPNAITTTQLNASSVTAAKIAALAVTAGKINVTNLSAINADLGSITAGNMTMDTAGYIQGGQTAYNTGTGFFLGYDTDAYKFSIGSPTGNRLTWDGSTLEVFGDVKVGEYIVDATEEIAAANTERSTTNDAAFTELKKFTLDRDGDVTVRVERYVTPSPTVSSARLRIKREGVTQVTSTFSNTSYSAYTYDVTGCSEGDEITIELEAGTWFSDENEPAETFIRNCSLRATVTIIGNATVNTD